MNERLKQVRKAMNKTQKEFGSMLGVNRGTYASYETGRVIPNDTFIQLLCSLFNVNEEWLRNGTAEMFIETKQTMLDELTATHGLTEKETAIISTFLDLSPEGREVIIDFATDIVRKCGTLPEKENTVDVMETINRTNKIAEELAKKHTNTSV